MKFPNTSTSICTLLFLMYCPNPFLCVTMLPSVVTLLVHCATGREADSKQIDEMLKEAPGQLNFTHFLTLFGEKMHGKGPLHVFLCVSFLLLFVLLPILGVITFQSTEEMLHRLLSLLCIFQFCILPQNINNGSVFDHVDI